MPYAGLGSIFGSLEPDQQDEVLDQVAKEAAIRFATYLSVVKDGVNLRDLKGEDALNFYRARSPEDWTALEQLNPEAHAQALREWARLQDEMDARLAKMVAEVAPSSIKGLARSRVTEKQATAKIKQVTGRPQF